MLFMGSLSVALLTVKEEVNQKVAQVFMYLQEHARELMEETKLEALITDFKGGHGKIESFDAVNGSLFKIIYEAINNTLTLINWWCFLLQS